MVDSLTRKVRVTIATCMSLYTKVYSLINYVFYIYYFMNLLAFCTLSLYKPDITLPNFTLHRRHNFRKILSLKIN